MYRFSAHLGRLGVTSHKFSSLARSKISSNSTFVYNSARCISSSQTGQMKNSQESWHSGESGNKWSMVLGGTALALGLALYANQKSETVYAQSPDVAEIPEEVPYLIVGGGAAAVAACRAIRSREPDAKVLIVGEEKHVPYKRHPLSKEMWFTKNEELVNGLKYKSWGDEEMSLAYEQDSNFGPANVISGHKVVKLDVAAQKAVLDNGSEIKFVKCLIATGSKPKSVKWIDDSGPEVAKKVTYFKNIEDFQNVNEATDKATNVVVVGSGFLGTELAYALARKGEKSGMKVYHLTNCGGNAVQILPEYLKNWTNNKMHYLGGQVRSMSLPVERCSYDEKAKSVNLKMYGYAEMPIDHIVVAEDCEAVVDLGQVSGLEVDPDHGGFVVNAELEARSNVWVAGDASCYFDILLGRRRVEHQEHAEKSGTLAGENMTGAHKPYRHQPMFWSECGPEMQYQSVGICDAKLDTIGVFFKNEVPEALDDSSKVVVVTTKNKKIADVVGINVDSEATEVKGLVGGGALTKYNRGLVFYLREGRPVGTVFWNMPDATKALPLVDELLKAPELEGASSLPDLEQFREEFARIRPHLERIERPNK